MRKNSALTTETPTNLSTHDDSTIPEAELVDESILQQMIKDTSTDVIPPFD